MRFVPLVPAEFDPGPWAGFPALELSWTGPAHPLWRKAGPPVHALHLPEAPWTEALGETAMAALRARLEPDFLVLAAAAPEGRLESSRFLAVLEGLLELTHGTGVKLALRCRAGAAPELVRLLRAARGEAVGFCWDRQLGADLDCVSDRLFCALAGPLDDLAGLQALGYRWNVAVPAEEPDRARAVLAELARRHPEVLFPAGLAAPGETP